jgi:uncharacterized coiled-coil protein SlyX
MSPRIIHIPLSGGDRKAQAKGIRYAHGIHESAYRESVLIRSAGEAKIREADRLECEAWNLVFSPKTARGPRRRRAPPAFDICRGLGGHIDRPRLVLLQRAFSASSQPGSPIVATTAPAQVSKELLETTKGLQVTQQQAVDQLQVVQDQLVAQKDETRKLSEQVATLAEKLQALQQSVANISAAATAAPAPPPRSNH